MRPAKGQVDTGTAQVIDLAAARERLPGERQVERLSDGRRKGNHGNRASAPMRVATIAQLEEVLALRGEVTAADKDACASAAGVALRTINRWWEQTCQYKLNNARDTHPGPRAPTDQPDDAGTETDGCVPTCSDFTHGRGCRTGLTTGSLPGWLYKFNEVDRLQLTPDEVAFFATHSTIIDAIEAVHQDPTSRLRHYATSTLYRAWADVSEPVRIGAKYDATRQRKNEATFPLSGAESLNDSWSIDEYDLKVVASYRGVTVEPKVLIVRERHSGLPLAKIVTPRAATGTDTGTVLAAAAIGYTVPHPTDPSRELRVSGVARYLNSDQGGTFMGENGAAAARRLGIGNAPIPSHQPQANGDHEVMHQSLLRLFRDGAGSRRGWVDRAGQRLDHGELPYEDVEEAVEEWFATFAHAVYAKGERAGMSRLEVYAQAQDEGRVYAGHDLLAEDEAALATIVGERIFDVTRGLQWDRRHWLSRDLANRAVDGQKVVIARLLNPDVLYVFDKHNIFLAVVEPRDQPDPVDQHGLYQDRNRRERFVADAGTRRAVEANDDAATAWDQVADGLADAAEEAEDEAVRAINAQREAADPGTPVILAEGDPLTEANAQDMTEDIAEDAKADGTSDLDVGDRREVVRPTRRGRRHTAPRTADTARPSGADELTGDSDDSEDFAEASVRRLEAARAERARRRVQQAPDPAEDQGGDDDAS
ncbi:hypothetical protein [Nocardioides sp. AX2bis]|uniref:hypothetical protein n=1 Tax=Nocardioides sp. AX2bis TaxID=2653157 RepID=UPI0012F37A0D|nr:hypothetical protein [Nocardioides sp. AX2bis]VXC26529.1 conserved hypothetical protein [Nocardioides sp. AX2bis]